MKKSRFLLSVLPLSLTFNLGYAKSCPKNSDFNYDENSKNANMYFRTVPILSAQTIEKNSISETVNFNKMFESYLISNLEKNNVNLKNIKITSSYLGYFVNINNLSKSNVCAVSNLQLNIQNSLSKQYITEFNIKNINDNNSIIVNSSGFLYTPAVIENQEKKNDYYLVNLLFLNESNVLTQRIMGFYEKTKFDFTNPYSESIQSFSVGKNVKIIIKNSTIANDK